MLAYPYGWMIAGGLFFLLIIVIACSSPVVFHGSFQRIGNNNKAEIRIKALYGIIHYRLNVPRMKFSGMSLKLKEQVSTSNAGMNTWKQFHEEIDADKVVTYFDKLKRQLEMTYNLTGWFKHSLTKVRISEWNWSTSVGTGDAMWTAMTVGLVWSIKASIIGLLSQMVHLNKEPAMSITPKYEHPAFTTEWSCIAQIRFGYAILAGLQLLVRMKNVKGGVKVWQNILFKA